MADDTTRIINLTEATEISDGMYLVTDASTGTRKLSLQKVLDKVGGNVANDYDATATYDVGDLVVYKGVLYECSTEISTAEAWNPDHWSRINLGDIVADIDGSIDALNEDKANKSGEYDSIVAGTAKQLLSTQMVEDQTPYLFRTSGGSTDIGNREYLRKIVGGTLGWNQLQATPTALSGTVSGITATVENGRIKITGTASESGNITISPSADGGNAVPANHVLLLLATGKGNVKLGRAGTGAGVSNNYTFSKVSSSFYCATYFYIENGVTYDLDKEVMTIDLTLLFGSTIADYIYSLEQATAGSGVAWLKKYFQNLFEYHEYSEPTLKSVEGLVSHDMVGFNQWDEEWRNGYYNPITGVFASSNQYICSKNAIPVLPSTTYYIKTSSNEFEICELDANKNFLRQLRSGIIDATFATDADAHYIQIGSHTANAMTSYDPSTKPICINLSWPGTRNGEYEPYEKHSYPLDSSVTLRGIPKLDANNQLYFDGDEYEADGTVTRRYGIVDLGSLTWTEYGSTSDYTRYISSGIDSNSKVNGACICDSFIYRGTASVDANQIWVGTGNGRLSVTTTKDKYQDSSAFKTAMSGVMLVYELATPTTETATPYEELQIVNDFGTEEFVTTGLVPVGNVTEYPANLRDKLQHLPDLADGDGFYLIQQVGTQMELVAFHIPKATGLADGTYTLKATVSGGTPTYTWESD